MKTSTFTEAHIAFVLTQADEGTVVAEVCRKAGISEAAFTNWCKRYGGRMPSEVRTLRQTEGDVNRLKLVKRQMYGRAELDLLEARLIGAP